MKIKEIFFPKIETELKSEFRFAMLRDNLSRIKALASVVILFETVLAVSDIVSAMLKLDDRFQFDGYLILYIVMIAVNVFVLIHTMRSGEISVKSVPSRIVLSRMVAGYIMFMQCWGSVVSLMDQALYGQLLTYVINVMICSTLFYLEWKVLSAAYLLSAGILFVGLPFFQKSGDILVGHYVNLTVFLAIAFTCSRILFYNYYHDFKNKKLIEKMQLHLRNLSFRDELTNIPNRRSLNDYIDSKSLGEPNPGATVSVIMIDVDLFKQFNDRYGHLEGDRVLVEVAEQIYQCADHSEDFAARVGGEEFIYVAENQTREQTLEIAEKMRKKIMDLAILQEDSQHGCVTISLGVTVVRRTEENAVLKGIEFADKALYKAKLCGRNCIQYLDEDRF